MTVRRLVFDELTGQLTTTERERPAHIAPRCTCGRLFLRVRLTSGWASVCLVCDVPSRVKKAVDGTNGAA